VRSGGSARVRPDLKQLVAGVMRRPEHDVPEVTPGSPGPPAPKTRAARSTRPSDLHPPRCTAPGTMRVGDRSRMRRLDLQHRRGPQTRRSAGGRSGRRHCAPSGPR
jgi:hypothetical protein